MAYLESYFHPSFLEAFGGNADGSLPDVSWDRWVIMMLQRVPIGPVGSHLPSACEAGGFVVSWDGLTLPFLWAFVQTVTYVWDNLPPPDNHMSLPLFLSLYCYSRSFFPERFPWWS